MQTYAVCVTILRWRNRYLLQENQTLVLAREQTLRSRKGFIVSVLVCVTFTRKVNKVRDWSWALHNLHKMQRPREEIGQMSPINTNDVISNDRGINIYPLFHGSHWLLFRWLLLEHHKKYSEDQTQYLSFLARGSRMMGSFVDPYVNL